MALQIDTGSRYFRYGVVWTTIALVEFLILIYLNQWLETSLWLLLFLSAGTAFFATGWIFRNQYLD